MTATSPTFPQVPPRPPAPVRVFVIDWELAALPGRLEQVRAAGAEVVGAEAEDGQRAFNEVRRIAPDLLVVWLQCKPSHGRMTAAAIRSAAWGRKLPILFVTDDPDPVPPATLARVREAAPDAIVDRVGRLAFWVGRVGALVEEHNP